MFGRSSNLDRATCCSRAIYFEINLAGAPRGGWNSSEHAELETNSILISAPSEVSWPLAAWIRTVCETKVQPPTETALKWKK